ncbi:MAG: hypothetical protein H6732_03085 [Alphaproteobacteria bacterium]|nr:hypothetical protein [Alphaproteobacteria bacterium]
MACAPAAPDGDDSDTDAVADTDTVDAPDPLAWSPQARGPYQVGFRTWEVSYTLRPGETRTIGLNVWYPTDATDGPVLSYAGIAPATDTLGDAPPAAPVHAGGFPLLAYSHGDRGFGGTSGELMGWMASHGWAAVAPDHRGNLLTEGTDNPQEHWHHRPADIAAVVDALRDLPASDPLAGLVATDRYVMSGHSRGGSTVWSVAGAAFEGEPDAWCPGCTDDQRMPFLDGSLADPRAEAFVLLATGVRNSLFGDAGHRQAADSPWLLLTGTADNDGGVQAWADLDGFGAVWAQLAGGCHQTFALGSCPTLDPVLGFRLVDSYVLAFARAHLLGDDGEEVGGLLDGTLVPDPVVTFSRRD